MASPQQQQGSQGTLKVLHVAPTFFPAVYWGGTIHCNLGLCDALAGLPNVIVSVLTTDSAGLRRDERVVHSGGEVTFPAGYNVRYARRRFGVSISFELLRKLWPMVKVADVVHLTSAYSFPTIPTILVCRLLGKPLLWSPHGALQRWEGSRKPIVKTAWEAVCNAFMDRRRCTLHVTSEMEAAESMKKVRCAQAEIIPHGVDIPNPLPARTWQPAGMLRLMFIGRLDQKKGIENLIVAMTKLDTDTTLDIYGAGDDAYVKGLKENVLRAGVTARVRFHGHVEGKVKSAAFWNADICVVPSHTENFAMVVVEALAHGVPVIASTGTPWQKLTERQCGAWVSNEPAVLAATIEELRRSDLESMGVRGRDWMQRDYSWVSVAGRMRALYSGLVNRARS